MRKISLAILVLIVATALVAQTNPDTAARIAQIPVDSHMVSTGDNLSVLARTYLHDGNRWNEILEQNPFLRDRVIEYPPSAKYPEGMTDVRIYPGETIQGLNPSEIASITGGASTTTAPPSLPSDRPRAYQTDVESFPIYDVQRDATFPWWTLLLVIAFLALLTWTVRYFARPAQAGRPMVPANRQTRNVAENMDNAAAAYVTRTTGAPVTDQNRARRVSEIRRVTLNGTGRVGYAGQRNMPLRYFQNQNGYQATFEFPDGRREELTFLQQCMNDVIFSNMRYLDFTITPGHTVVAAPAEVLVTNATATPAAATTSVVPEPPTPTPTPEPPAPAAPAGPLAEVVNIADRGMTPETRIRVGDRVISFSGDSDINVNGKTVEVTFTDGGTMSIGAAPVKKAKKAKVQPASHENVG